MKEEEIKKLIRSEVRNFPGNSFVTFSCPYCKRVTIAIRKYIVPGSFPSVYYPPLDQWMDRQCLVCGKLFQQRHVCKYEEYESKEEIK